MKCPCWRSTIGNGRLRNAIRTTSGRRIWASHSWWPHPEIGPGRQAADHRLRALPGGQRVGQARSRARPEKRLRRCRLLLSGEPRRSPADHRPGFRAGPDFFRSSARREDGDLPAQDAGLPGLHADGPRCGRPQGAQAARGVQHEPGAAARRAGRSGVGQFPSSQPVAAASSAAGPTPTTAASPSSRRRTTSPACSSSRRTARGR